MGNTKKVIVEVSGGVAEVTLCPLDVDVEIIDHDNEDTTNWEDNKMNLFNGFLTRVEKNRGLTKKQIQKMVDLMPDTSTEYVPFVSHGNIYKHGALGFIDKEIEEKETHEEHLEMMCNLDDQFVDNWDFEKQGNVYPLDDNGKYYIHVQLGTDEEDEKEAGEDLENVG